MILLWIIYWNNLTDHVYCTKFVLSNNKMLKTNFKVLEVKLIGDHKLLQQGNYFRCCHHSFFLHSSNFFESLIILSILKCSCCLPARVDSMHLTFKNRVQLLFLQKNHLWLSSSRKIKAYISCFKPTVDITLPWEVCTVSNLWFFCHRNNINDLLLKPYFQNVISVTILE